jgi:hypothetical protein
MRVLCLLLSVWFLVDATVAIALGRFHAAGEVRRHG